MADDMIMIYMLIVAVWFVLFPLGVLSRILARLMK